MYWVIFLPWWCSGNIIAFQAIASGSIPGWGTIFKLAVAQLVEQWIVVVIIFQRSLVQIQVVRLLNF